jgi:rhodanese-related sulfurtransferase
MPRLSLVSAVVLSLAAAMPMSSGVAQTGETPVSLPGAKTISPADVHAMRGKIAVLDVRKKASYLEGRVPGAIYIRDFEITGTNTYRPEAFGPDKTRALVIYSHGSDGWVSVHAVRSAVGAAYTNVYWMREGWNGWSLAKLPVE